MHRFLPNQTNLNKILNAIQKLILKGAYLHMLIKQIQSSYLTSLYFKDIYKYLVQNKLPKPKVVLFQKETLAQGHILLDSLLFKLLWNQRMKGHCYAF